jgi:lipid-A-disaccharide synthase
MVVLLPGSRIEEVRRHWPLLLTVAEQIAAELPCSFKAIFPTDELVGLTSEDECRARARSLRDKGVELDIQIGGVNDALAQADLAITKSGTVTVECALYRVPAVVFYQMKWLTYAIAKRIVTVKHFSMPNLLANDEIYPEFVQDAATPENLARAGVELLRNSSRRADVQKRLAQVVASLGAPGAPNRAAKAILELLA